MYGIFEVFDKKPSGRPSDQWPDFTLINGKFYEKVLIGTQPTAEAAQNVVDIRQTADSNTFYYTKID